MLFNPSQAYMPNRHRQRSALRTFFPSSSFSPPDSKEPLRRGILFSSVATVLLLIGAILTWLGFNDVFGGKISMTGPLLIALALLMLLLSFRQFMLARKRNRSTNGPVQMEAVSAGGITALVVDHDDGRGAATIVVETWESEEPNHDTVSYRNTQDLAPPSYMDIAQSCSSNCPSFISHEDHNEAPPTYEETCGAYNSQTSLNNASSRRSSSQFEGSPSPVRSYRFFQSDGSFSQINKKSDQSVKLSSTLCPSDLVTLSQSESSQAQTKFAENNIPLPRSFVDSNFTSTTSSCQHFLPWVTDLTNPGNSAEPSGTCSRSSDWSRKSFSSIPSYTCLLSESGEVSSHVFDTSSIIEEMMPLLAVRDQGPTDPSLVPSRSHSLSSVSSSRQGVPYSSQLHSRPTTPETAILPDLLLMSENSSASSVRHCNSSNLITGSTSLHLQNPAHREEHLLMAQTLQVDGTVLLQQQSLKGSVISTPPLCTSKSEGTSKKEKRQEPLLEASLPVRRQSDSSFTMASQDSSRILGQKLPTTQDVQETI